MNPRRTDFWCALLLIAIATFFFSDVLFLGGNFWLRDLFTYHFPMKHIVRETVARGEFPWWNPYFAAGQPMAANPAYEIFYPPQWLIFVGSYPFGFALHIVFHVYVALLGMYFFLRSIPLRVEAAMFGALSFGFSGFFLSTTTNLPTFFVWSWAGVVGWAVLHLVRTRRIVPVGLALAMPLLVLEPVALVQMISLVIAGTALVDRRALLRVFAAMAVATALAAVVIIPAIDHARDSARSRGLPFNVVVDYSMPPVRPVELIAPRALWSVGSHVFGWRGTPYFPSIYCGLAVAILAMAGLITRQRGSLAVVVICAISYVLAIGSHTPLFSWLYAAGMRSVRYPEKFAAAGLITLIIFAAISADRFLQTRRVNLILLGLVLVDLTWFSNQVLPRMPAQFFTPPPIVSALEPGATVYHRGEWTQQSIARTYERISPAYSTRNALRPFSPALWGLRSVLEADVDETFLLPTHDLLDAMIRRGNSGDPHWSDAFVAISNVRYVIDYKQANIDHPILVTRVPSRGRFYFSSGDGRILRASESSSMAAIDVETSGDALMSITITRHKYWRAMIDGRAATLQPANLAYQALLIPAGKHHIQLRYRNPVVMWSAAVSALFFIALVLHHVILSGAKDLK